MDEVPNTSDPYSNRQLTPDSFANSPVQLGIDHVAQWGFPGESKTEANEHEDGNEKPPCSASSHTSNAASERKEDMPRLGGDQELTESCSSPTSLAPTKLEASSSSHDLVQQWFPRPGGGINPIQRKLIKDVEIRTLYEEEERRRINSKNFDIEEWISQAGEIAEDETPASSSLFNFNPFRSQPASFQLSYEDESDIPPVDDAASIRENKVIEGQVYYDQDNLNITETDVALLALPRQWYDAPTVSQILTTSHQHLTSNEAMMRYQQASDAVSISSRAATWGTRRRQLSEPSLSEYDAAIDGSFLRRLSISKSREGEGRPNNPFNQGLDRLDRLANIIRMRSDSKLKRARSDGSEMPRVVVPSLFRQAMNAIPLSRRLPPGTTWTRRWVTIRMHPCIRSLSIWRLLNMALWNHMV
jgi:hypothetical protein